MRISGKVVKEGNTPRFVPDDSPEARLRLTGLAKHLPEGPEMQEIDLQKYSSRRMSFECQKYDAQWAWGVQEGSLQLDADAV